MTEYDYSPAAWEQHIAQQARVSKWVNQTTAQAHYSDPSTLSPTLRDRSFYDEPDRAPRRPAPTRSKTLNIPHSRQEVHYRHTPLRPFYEREHDRSRSRSLENRSSSSSTKPHSARSSSRTHTSSNYKPPSRPYNVQVLYPQPAPPPPQPLHYAQPYQKRLQPVRQHTSPAYYYPEQSRGSHQRTTYLQPGQSYIIPNSRVEYHYMVRFCQSACVIIPTLMLFVCFVLAS